MGQYMCDTSWLTESPINPLGIGQYVNNQSPGWLAISHCCNDLILLNG